MNRRIWIGAAVVAIVVVALILGYCARNQQSPVVSTTPSDTPAPETAAPGTGQAPAESAPAETAAVPTTTAPADGAAAPTSAPAEPAEPQRPSFDVVRVDSQGGMVIAGRAAPGSDVTVTGDGSAIGTAPADESGEWVLLPSSPLGPGNHTLELSAKLPDGRTVAGDQQVLLVVPEPKVTASGAQPAGNETLVVLVPQGDEGGSQILQAPSVEAPAEGAPRLSLDAIDYDDAGRVTVSGRATPRATVQIYLDNQLIGDAPVDGGGRWSFALPDAVDTEPHILRIDEIGGDGRVMARVESPFQRAEQLALAQDETFVVQPGNSLWRIARRTYGEGLRYTVIFEANKEQIRDPDLIYPGQVFVLPPTDGAN